MAAAPKRPMKRVIIAGSRSIYLLPKEILAIVKREDPTGLLWVPEEWTEIVSGRANGIDQAGEELARHLRKPVKPFPVTNEAYERFGKYVAPKRRNEEMAVYADGAIIVWDDMSGGSADMACRMSKHRKPVMVVYHPANRGQQSF